ncbi:MAG TPA: beta-propeller fold lactonase family protein, partial [Chthoniobacteraceae bacterium]
MNPLAAIAFTTAMTLSTHAAEVTFYLGTYTKSGKSQGIYQGKLDTETGRLGTVELAGEAKDPSFLALTPRGDFLYAALEEGGGSVGAFAVEAQGKLRALNTLPCGPGTCHVWVDPTGSKVLAANYSGGSVAVFGTKADGSLGERTGFVQLEGRGPDPVRQQKPFGHAIYTDAENRFVYVCDLGTDSVWVFQFDPEKGTLNPAASGPGKVPPGAGPRHLAIHPSGRFLYAANELGLSVTTFARDPGTGG